MLTQSLLLALATSAFAAPYSAPYLLHEKRSTKLEGRTTRLADNAIVPIRIGLTQSNLDQTYSHLMDVSDPASSNYGKHWSLDQVDSMYAPSGHTIKAVKEWLVSSGIDADSIASSRSQGWLAVDMPARQAESLFKTQYYEHESDNDGTVRLGCDSYHLPSHLVDHIDMIKPGISLSAPLTKKSMKRSPVPSTKWDGSIGSFQEASFDIASANGAAPHLAHCSKFISPACIKALYAIPDAQNFTADPANSLGIFESGDVYAQKDLNLYYKNIDPRIPQGTHPITHLIDGAKAPVGINNPADGGESDVDFTMAYSLIYPQTVTLYQEPNVQATPKTKDDITLITPFLDAIDGSFCSSQDRKGGLQCGVYNLTRVVSMSYGTPELDPDYGSAIAQQRACNEIAKLSLQGTTFVVSSGDYGVAAHPHEGTNGCAARTSSGIKPFPKNGTIFSPSFPASCPYVLSVGATQLNAGETVADPETVMNPGAKNAQPDGVGATFSSSGGFSNVFQQPSYQSAAVNAYFKKYDPGYPYYHAVNNTGVGTNGGIYNRGGRAFPDVSANGAFLAIYAEGNATLSYGTSLSAPLWASLITLINEKRCAAGKGPVGFVNPTLYANTQVFHDITKGSNPGCNTVGFPAVPGWDASTGLGTPDFPSLLKVFLNLP